MPLLILVPTFSSKPPLAICSLKYGSFTPNQPGLAACDEPAPDCSFLGAGVVAALGIIIPIPPPPPPPPIIIVRPKASLSCFGFKPNNRPDKAVAPNVVEEPL